MGYTRKSRARGQYHNCNNYMCEHNVYMHTRACSYDNYESGPTDKDFSHPNQVTLYIQRINPLIQYFTPYKGVLQRFTHNPNAYVAHNYRIIEDLAQALCDMSSLEVLQSYPMQYKALLTTICEVVPQTLILLHLTLIELVLGFPTRFLSISKYLRVTQTSFGVFLTKEPLLILCQCLVGESWVLQILFHHLLC